MKHQLHIERDREDGGWSVYLRDREDAIGHVRRTPNGRWAGEIVLDGQWDMPPTEDDPQVIVDRFLSFAATGIPSHSNLASENLAKTRTRVAKLAGGSKD
jgi:hypothetical protein